MATNPLRQDLNRANQIKSSKTDVKQSVSLFDVDYAIMTYLENVVLATLDDNGKALKIPVVYGNSERWNGARRQGVYRDLHGKIQLPLMMIKRTSVAKNETMPMLNRHVSYQAVTKYSKDNRYSRFTLLGKATTPKYEIHNITMPDYVEINYECMGWTNKPSNLPFPVTSVSVATTILLLLNDFLVVASPSNFSGSKYALTFKVNSTLLILSVPSPTSLTTL